MRRPRGKPVFLASVLQPLSFNSSKSARQACFASSTAVLRAVASQQNQHCSTCSCAGRVDAPRRQPRHV